MKNLSLSVLDKDSVHSERTLYFATIELDGSLPGTFLSHYTVNSRFCVLLHRKNDLYHCPCVATAQTSPQRPQIEPVSNHSPLADTCTPECFQRLRQATFQKKKERGKKGHLPCVFTIQLLSFHGQLKESARPNTLSPADLYPQRFADRRTRPSFGSWINGKFNELPTKTLVNRRAA